MITRIPDEPAPDFKLNDATSAPLSPIEGKKLLAVYRYSLDGKDISLWSFLDLAAISKEIDTDFPGKLATLDVRPLGSTGLKEVRVLVWES